MMVHLTDNKVEYSALDRVSQALPQPILLIADDLSITDANHAAEEFFAMGISLLRRSSLERLCGPNSALVNMIRTAQAKGSSFMMYRVMA
jgi:two-component system, NtrC family, nitrogen regulation sensor histidine kinase GlnL